MRPFGARYPASLVFDHDPVAEELAQIVGPDFAASYVRWYEDDEIIRIAPQRIPFRALVVFMLLFCGTLTSAPWWLPGFGVYLPPYLDDSFLLAMVIVLWVFIVPSMIGILWWLHRVAKKLGPGLILTKRTGEMQLPWIDQTVPRDGILRFVDLRGRHRYGGGANVALVGQYCVLFRDGQDRIIYAPFARLTTRRTGRTAVQRLAGFYDLPVQRVEAGML